MRVANPSVARIKQQGEKEKDACNWRSAGCAPGSAGAQRRMHEWQKSAGISYPEFSFGAVKDRRRRRSRLESNSAALPSSGASLHPMTPVPVRCVPGGECGAGGGRGTAVTLLPYQRNRQLEVG